MLSRSHYVKVFFQTNQKLKCQSIISLQWRHNGCDGVSNHQPHHCLLNRLFRRRSQKTSKLRVTGLCVGISPVTVSIWWRHHVFSSDLLVLIGTGEGATEIGVAIGGTTNFIRVVGETDYLANTTSSGELSCKDAREFWVSWKDGHIQV